MIALPSGSLQQSLSSDINDSDSSMTAQPSISLQQNGSNDINDSDKDDVKPSVSYSPTRPNYRIRISVPMDSETDEDDVDDNKADIKPWLRRFTGPCNETHGDDDDDDDDDDTNHMSVKKEVDERKRKRKGSKKERKRRKSDH